MRTKTTLVLAALALCAALFFYLVEQPRHARETKRIAQEDRFTATRLEEVHFVSIDRPDLAISAVREGERWRLTAPVDDSADDPAFNVLVLATCNARVEARFDVERSEFSEYGLSPPSATVGFAAADGERLLELRIGDLNPYGSHCYALAGDGQEVILLPSGVRRYALRSLFEYRDKRIVDVEIHDVERIEVASRERTLRWTADGHGGWFAVQGADTIPGNKTAVERIVRQLRGLRAIDVPYGEPETAAVHPSEHIGMIVLSTRADSAGISLTFSGLRGDTCQVMTSQTGRRALVDTTMVPVFAKTLDDFRDKRLLAFDDDALARIAWNTPERSLTILKRDGAWTYANPGLGRISAAGARRLLSTMAALEFTAIIERRLADPTGHGFDEPALRLTLRDAEGLLIDEVVVGSLRPEGASHYAWSFSTRSLTAVEPASVLRLADDFSNLGNP